MKQIHFIYIVKGFFLLWREYCKVQWQACIPFKVQWTQFSDEYHLWNRHINTSTHFGVEARISHKPPLTFSLYVFFPLKYRHAFLVVVGFKLGISQVLGKQSTTPSCIFSPMLKGCLLTGEKTGMDCTGNTQFNHFSLNDFRKVPWLVSFLGDSFVNGENNTYFMDPLSDTLSYT